MNRRPYLNSTPEVAEQLDRFLIKTDDLLVKAYKFLFESGCAEGHWNEARSTALAGMCIEWAVPNGHPWRDAVKKSVFDSQITTGPDAGSWGDEIWDTAMSVLALKDLGVSSHDTPILQALGWISNHFSLNGRGNWHDEPWETCWALIALLQSGTFEHVDVREPLKWLLAFQDEQGQILAPHYTAYFIHICTLLPKANLPQGIRENIQTGRRRAADFLIQMLQTSKSGLWTGEAWSNGQILWMLASAHEFPVADESSVTKVLDWFTSTQKSEGNWADVEDTASAVLGLTRLVQALMPSVSDQDAENRVRGYLLGIITVPTLQLNLRLVQYQPQIDCYSINLTKRRRKLLFIVGGIATAMATLAELVDFTWNHWMRK
jgi:hypothetical protein